ncbi:magnesium/cobalt transporter CorA [Candidatus Woesearchaeota archaeon]|nr:magnesium/cobalt transporter CorA [Candidatus Woesearchaeota archaeon]
MIDICYYSGGLKKANLADLPKLKYSDVWIDATNISDMEADVLNKHFNLHPLTIEDLKAHRTRIKVEAFPTYLFCVFYVINPKNKAELLELNLVLGKDYVISNHITPLPFISELKENKERLETLFRKGPDFILHKILDSEISNYLPVLEGIGDEIERIEERIIVKPRKEQSSEILRIKKRILKMRRSVMQQRDKMAMLAKEEHSYISHKAIPYFRDIYDNSIRLVDMIDNEREAAASAYEIYISSLSNSVSEVMKALGLIATIALPLTVIAGIYGTNFSVLPGAKFAYGFWVMIAMMSLLSIFMVLRFKKKGWL